MPNRLVLAGVGDLLEVGDLQSPGLFLRHGSADTNLLAIMSQEGVVVTLQAELAAGRR